METGENGGGRAEEGQGGFTLLELILTISVLALLATLFIGASSSLLSDRPTTPDEVFQKAAQTARKDALRLGHDVRLSYDDKTQSFVEDTGEAVHSFTIPAATQDFSASFLSQGSGGNAMLIGGTLVQTQTVPFVTYYSDGTCSPFNIQFRVSGGAHSIKIDPWTCAPMLSAADAAAP